MIEVFLFRLLGKLLKSEMAYFADRALDLERVRYFTIFASQT